MPFKRCNNPDLKKKERVLATGVFDFFHPGHYFFLSAAKKLGKRLIVIVARDENVLKNKGILPSQSENERLQNVQLSGIADTVFLGKKGTDILCIVEKIAPDILALGYDQIVPENFSSRFPTVQIVHIPALNPEKWKSSNFRIASPLCSYSISILKKKGETKNSEKL